MGNSTASTASTTLTARLPLGESSTTMGLMAATGTQAAMTPTWVAKASSAGESRTITPSTRAMTTARR